MILSLTVSFPRRLRIFREDTGKEVIKISRCKKYLITRSPVLIRIEAKVL